LRQSLSQTDIDDKIPATWEAEAGGSQVQDQSNLFHKVKLPSQKREEKNLHLQTKEKKRWYQITC
jgi:hypothetical protein